MASIFKGKPDSRGRRKWVVEYTDHDGKRRQKVGYTDKRLTERLAADLENRASLVRDGLADPGDNERRVQAGREIGDHLADYETHLRARSRSSEKRIRKIRSTISKTAEACGWKRAGDIDSTTLARELEQLAKAGLAATTIRDRLVIVKGFARYLAEHQRLPSNPLISLHAADAKVLKREPKIRRRALSDSEISRLLLATEQAGDWVVIPKRYKARSGPNLGKVVVGTRRLYIEHRATLYRLALGTGLRVDEIRSLTPESFDLDHPDGPIVTVAATATKNKKAAVLPLTTSLAGAIRSVLAVCAARERVWGTIPGNMAPVIAEDLRAAEIAPVNAEGQRVDFHALRHTFITRLVRSGVDPKQAQELARHSDIRLTMERYTHAGLDESRRALDRVPEVPMIDTPQRVEHGPERAVASDQCKYLSKYSGRIPMLRLAHLGMQENAAHDEGGVDKSRDPKDFCVDLHGGAASSSKATLGTRTPDLSFTKASLYQLS